MQTLCILGSTGSIGKSTLDVVRLHPEKFDIVSLSAHSSVELMFDQCVEFKPSKVVMVSKQHAKVLISKLKAANLNDIDVTSGTLALENIAQDDATDTVMAAIVGASGLLPTLAAVKAGKKVLLANKEALVTSGAIFIEAVKQSGAQLLPIDSEHNAIFQCLPLNAQQQPGYCDLSHEGVSKVLLTGSGGPFRTWDLDDLEHVTPSQACAHPNWDMGRKISVDSATMMNKGLEFIEARWLFGLKASDIQIVLHPQSIIHSMVQYIDGSVLAQMGNPDMRTPIAHALAFPERIESGVLPLDFNQLANFTFTEPETERYPNLALAIQASSAGQYATTTLNAANEVAVEAFLQGQISFMQIAQVNDECLQQTSSHSLKTIEAVLESDKSARRLSINIIEKLSHIAQRINT